MESKNNWVQRSRENSNYWMLLVGDNMDMKSRGHKSNFRQEEEFIF